MPPVRAAFKLTISKPGHTKARSRELKTAESRAAHTGNLQRTATTAESRAQRHRDLKGQRN